MILHRISSAALIAGLLTSAYIANSTHDLPMGEWGDDHTAEVMEDRSHSWPKWNDSYAEQFPTCAPEVDADFPSSLAVDLTGEVRIYDFDEAWDRTHNDTAHDDLWIVGQCA